jgi:hypothetical protein
LRLATDQQEHQKAFGEGHYKMGAPFPVGSWYGSTTEELLKVPGYRQPKDQEAQADFAPDGELSPNRGRPLYSAQLETLGVSGE